MRHLILLLLIATLAPSLRAEHVIVTGGPALRKWENLRVPEDQHDRWWANFVRASTLRMVEIRKAYGANASIVWMVHRPGYRTRASEDGRPYTNWIADLARKRAVTLRWTDSGNDLINAINSRPRGSIQTFDYFGHSNKHCFMLDYGNDIMAAALSFTNQRCRLYRHMEPFAMHLVLGDVFSAHRLESSGADMQRQPRKTNSLGL